MSDRRTARALSGAALVVALVVALLAAVVLAVVRPSIGHTVAAALGAVLLVAALLALRLGRPVAGRRALPRWYAVAAAGVVLLTLVVRGVLSGWSTGATAAVAVALAAAPAALLVAVEVPLWRALRVGEAAGVTLGDTAALRPVKVLALDGMPTLVEGKVVSSVDPIEESHLRNLRWFAGALAHAADTPLGHAVAALAGRGNVTEAVTLEHEISGSVDRHPVRLSLAPVAVGALALGGPWDVVSVEVDGRSLGSLTIADALRPDATDALAALTRAGVETVLVAPAEDARAAAIATQAGCPLAIAAPPGAAVLTASSDRALGIADAGARVLGPHSDALRLTGATVGYAAAALALCHTVAGATRRAVTVALALSAVDAVLAAVGLLAPWAAAAVALGVTVVAGAMAWTSVSAPERSG